MKTDLVRDWMTPDPICVGPQMTLPDAHKLMLDRRIRRLPVVDDNGRLVGIVTRGDVRGAEPSGATSLSIFEINYLIARITLSQIMTHNPIRVAPGTSLYEAARLMLQNKIAGLPVVDPDTHKVVGILTESDIFRLVVKRWDTEEAGVLTAIA